MKVALTVWGNRISPVFDSAKKILIVQIENRKIKSRQYTSFNFKLRGNMCEKLTDTGAEVLICGAISKEAYHFFDSSTIELIPFVSGNAEVVLESYIKKSYVSQIFFMPGSLNKHYRKKQES